MRFCLYVNQITPHLMPLAREMVKLIGESNVRYVYDRPLEAGRTDLGWDGAAEEWVVNLREKNEEAQAWIREADVLICERRDMAVWEMRGKSGKGMFYTSERWFKPMKGGLPGWLRLFYPHFFKMAYQAVKLFDRHQNLVYLCDGYYAARDFAQLRHVMHGRIWSLLFPPKIDIGLSPFDKVCVNGSADDQLRNWGYFVAPSPYSSSSTFNIQSLTSARPTRVLWVGRFLRLKHVDTLIKAIFGCSNLELDLCGFGPDEARLKELAHGVSNVHFHGPVPVSGVRELMRTHDVYVLPSNGYEGWGAVVSEALEEGMCVYGTYEAGASRTLLPKENLFHCGDWRTLRKLLLQSPNKMSIGAWSVREAAKRIVESFK